MFNLKKEKILKYLSSIKKELNQDGIVEIGLFGFEGVIYLDNLRQK